MAHYALLDQNNIVKCVMVIHDEWEADGEVACAARCSKFFNTVDPVLYAGTWIKTSYNATMRKNFAGIGYKYDAIRDAFITTNPFPSWVLDEDKCRWVAPVPYPQDGKKYFWNEEKQAWVEVVAND